jgi:preprotein translocase subunit SecG
MELIVLIIHLLVCLCLIGLVLLQRSEGGALGMGGGAASSLMSGRGAADALARMTSVAGGFFLVTSITLTMISGAGASSDGGSVFDRLRQSAPVTSIPSPAPATPAQPEDTRPDPTESSIAADTQLASAAAPAPVEAAPAPVNAATRAAPLTSAPPATQRTSPPPTQRATTQPASSTQTRSPAPTTQRPAPATTRSTPTLQIPNTSGAVSGVTLTEDAASQTESIEVGNGVEAVRRERAGPDQ